MSSRFSFPHEIERPHVLENFKKNPHAHVIEVVAPAGYGKSAAIRHFMDAEQAPGVRVMTGTRGSDARGIANALVRELARNGLFSDGAPFTRGDADTYGGYGMGEEIGHRINETDVPLVLAVEDLDNVSTDASNVIAGLLDIVHPKRARVILAHRGSADLPLAKIQAAGRYMQINKGMLRFTSEETRTILNKVGRPEVDAALLADGWPIHVGLIASGGDPRRSLRQLVEDLLRQGASNIVHALETLSVWTAWEPGKESRLGLHDLPPSWLTDVKALGLPIEIETMVRPHNVVKEVLFERLRRDPERFERVHEIAAEEAIGSGDPSTAFQYLVTIGEYERAVDIVHNEVCSWARRSEWVNIVHTLGSIPTHALGEWEKSILSLAMFSIGNGVGASELLYEIEQRGEATGWAKLVAIQQAHRRKEYEQGVQLAEAALRGETDPAARGRLLRFKAAMLAEMRGEHLADAELAAEEALAIARSTNDVGLEIDSLSLPQYIRFAKGELEASIEVGTNVVNKALRARLPQKAMAGSHTLAAALYAVGRSRESFAFLDRLERIGRNATPLLRYWVHFDQGRAFLQLENLDEAERRLREATRIGEELGGGMFLYHPHYHLAEVGLLSGDAGAAERAVTKAARHADADDATQECALHAMRARIALLQGDVKTAAGEVREAKLMGEDVRFYEPEVGTWLVVCEAILAHRHGELTREHHDRLDETVRAVGYGWLLRRNDPLIKSLRSYFKVQGWALSQSEPEERASRMSTDEGKDVLHINPFERPLFKVRGRELELRAKAEEILTLLVSQGGAATRDWLMAAGWPELDEETARKRLNAQLKELRKELAAQVPGVERENAVVRDAAENRYVLKVPFQSQVELIDRAYQQRNWMELQELVDSYDGEAFPGMGGEWVEEARGEIHARVLGVLTGAMHATQSRSQSTARWFFDKAYNLDPRNEGLMESYSEFLNRIGDIGYAVEVRTKHRAFVAADYASS